MQLRTRTLKIIVGLPAGLNILRTHAYIRTHDRSYRPTSKGRAILRRNSRLIDKRRR